MATKMMSLALCVIVALGSVNSQYPAGVDPKLCPNYPHCDNAILGNHASAAAAQAHVARSQAAPSYAPRTPSYNTAPSYAPHTPSYSGAPSHASRTPSYNTAPSYEPHTPSYSAAAPSYNDASAYDGSSYESYENGPAVNVPVHEGYPAGVDPNACPNYPYCGPTPAHVPAAATKSSGSTAFYPESAPYVEAAPVSHAKAAPTSYAAPANYAKAAPSSYAAPANYAKAAPSSYAAPASGYFSYAGPGVTYSNGPQTNGHLYPSGLDPNSCPNYPYCH